MTPTARPRRATPKTPPDPLALLREVAIFADLAPPLLARLAAQGELIEAAADTVLLEQGSVAAFFNILLAGQVGLTSTAADGSTAVVEILRPVDQFQLAAAITAMPSLVSARAVGAVRLFRIPAAVLRELGESEPGLALAMLTSLSRQYRTLLHQVKDLKLRSAAQRLGCFILKLGGEQNFPQRIELPFDKQLLAARLGTTPENLSRAFATLRKYGVATRGGHVVVDDPLRLAAFAVPDEVA